MTIGDLFTKHGSDKNSRHSYGPFYDELLTPLKPGIRRMLEVGIAWGHSLKAWRDWFGPGVEIHGMDLTANPGPIDGVTQYLGCDSTKLDQVDAILRDLKFDLIVDDGDHHPDRQRETYQNLIGRLNPGGIYFVEDIQWEESYVMFRELGAEIIDRRHIKGVGDDVIAVFRVTTSTRSDFCCHKT